jgi:hypothetical protein
MPWPMTLAPTNEAIKRESSRKKPVKGKKNLPRNGMSSGCVDNYYYQDA